MLISDSHKFIFVHVYKTAGTSIRQALSAYAQPLKRPLCLRVLRRLGAQQLAQKNPLMAIHHHSSARQIQAAFTPGEFEQFYKFAFVRNPWDWQVSLYHHMLKEESHHQYELAKSFESFDQYIHWRVNNKRLQKDFVADEGGNLIVDFVGHLETLEPDFTLVCDRLGLNCQLSHLNRSAHKDYRSYYTPETAALVAEAFKADIEFFGYNFNGLKSSSETEYQTS